jgi:ribonuclease BN (tRNA processing enzyme)
MKSGIQPADVRKVFITHLHTDHTHGLSQFVIGGWIQGRRQLEIHGAGEVEHLVKTLFEEAYREDIASRLEVREGNGLTDIVTSRVTSDFLLETDHYRVTAAPAEHVLDAHAFRVDGDAGSVVLTGDTAYSADIVRLAQGAHTLVHECFMGERVPSGPLPKITRMHSTPEMAAQAAADAGVQRLVLTHFMPGVDPEDLSIRA